MAANPKSKPYSPVGPFSPPTPSEVDQREEGIPMAVANDIDTIHDAFMPTTSGQDSYEPDALEGEPSADALLPQSDAETRAAERPSGYSPVDDHGFRRMKTDEDDPDADS